MWKQDDWHALGGCLGGGSRGGILKKLLFLPSLFQIQNHAGILLWHLYHICTKYVLIVIVPPNFGGTAHFHEHGVVFPEVKHSSQVTVGSYCLGLLWVLPRIQQRNAFPRVPFSFQVNRVVKHTLVHERHLGVDVIITFLLYKKAPIAVTHLVEEGICNHAPSHDMTIVDDVLSVWKTSKGCLCAHALKSVEGYRRTRCLGIINPKTAVTEGTWCLHSPVRCAAGLEGSRSPFGHIVGAVTSSPVWGPDITSLMSVKKLQLFTTIYRVLTHTSGELRWWCRRAL